MKNTENTDVVVHVINNDALNLTYMTEGSIAKIIDGSSRTYDGDVNGVYLEVKNHKITVQPTANATPVTKYIANTLVNEDGWVSLVAFCKGQVTFSELSFEIVAS